MSKLRRTRTIVWIAAGLLVFAASSPVSQAANLDELYKQRDQLNQELKKNQSAAANKSNEVKTLEKQISSLESDISSTEQKIGTTSKEIGTTQEILDNLSKDIEVKKQELARLKVSLNAALVEIYRFSARSDFELLFSGESLGESTNQQEYIEAVEMRVEQVHQQVATAKNDLEKRKSDQEAEKARLDDLKKQQEAYRSGVEYQKTQKDKLLGMTVEQKNAYSQEAKDAQRKMAEVENQIRRILSSRGKRSDGTFGDGPGVGERVGRGDYVGTQGSTGFSTGDHVHFEVDQDGPARNWTSPWPYINSDRLSWPLDEFVITQDYGVESDWYKCGYHMGIDIAGPLGSPVFAPADGLVVLNEYFGGYGHAWAMKVDDGPYVLLGHLR